MASHTAHTAQLVQNRYILDKLNITMWAQRSSKIWQLPNYPDAITNTDDTKRCTTAALVADNFCAAENAQVTSQVTTNIQKRALSQAHPSQKQVTDTVSQTTQNTANQSQSTDDNTPTMQANKTNSLHANALAAQGMPKYSTAQSSDELLDIRYQLSAIRYRHWVLVVDEAHMDEVARAVWRSLSLALEKQAQHQQTAFCVRQFAFPVSPDAFDAIQEAGNLALAQSSFIGFLFGLSLGDAQVQVVFLTNMHIALQAPSDAAFTPSLTALAQNPEQKKQFWQQLNA